MKFPAVPAFVASARQDALKLHYWRAALCILSDVHSLCGP